MALVRYETAMLHNRRDGVRLGVFAAVNTLSKRGVLTPAQEAYRARTNDWYNRNLPLPTLLWPSLYDDHEQAAAWFKATAVVHLAPIPGYLAILDAHQVAWEARRDPAGDVLYEDAWQVIALPCSYMPRAALTSADAVSS